MSNIPHARSELKDISDALSGCFSIRYRSYDYILQYIDDYEMR